jgi:hypothetical protein
MARRRKRRRRRTAAAAPRRRRRRPVRSNPRRRRRRSVARLNPVRRRRRRYRSNARRRRYRRNPGFSGGGIVKMVTRGVQDGVVVLAGRGITNLVAAKVPFANTTAAGRGAVKLATGLALSIGIRKVFKSERVAAFFLAGAVSSVLEPFAAKIPVIGPALTGTASWPMLSAWPVSPVRALAGVGDDGMGDDFSGRGGGGGARGMRGVDGQYGQGYSDGIYN